jgi:hypothetical protein
MFRGAAGHPLPPQSKTPRLQTPTHHLDDFRLHQTSSPLDLLEGRSILPSHPDHTISEFIRHLKPLPSISGFATRHDQGKALSNLWTDHHMAKEVGEVLGRGEVLLQPLPEA